MANSINSEVRGGARWVQREKGFPVKCMPMSQQVAKFEFCFQPLIPYFWAFLLLKVQKCHFLGRVADPVFEMRSHPYPVFKPRLAQDPGFYFFFRIRLFFSEVGVGCGLFVGLILVQLKPTRIRNPDS